MNKIKERVDTLISRATDLSFKTGVHQLVIDFGESFCELLNDFQYSLTEEKTKIKSYSAEFGSLSYKIGTTLEVVREDLTEDVSVLNEIRSYCDELNQMIEEL